MEYKILVILHILSAAIWVGGGLILSFAILPRVRKENNNSMLVEFIKAFYKIGFAALALQFLTGFRLAMGHLPISEWFLFNGKASELIALKLALLLLTFILAFRARYFCLPEEGGKLTKISVNIYLTTLIGILLVLTGLSFRINIF
ncbi:MAG: copper resistance protein CopD [Chlorobi bacterium]|nr:copper resistance protein CopD [Chlorobiota bacterium]